MFMLKNQHGPELSEAKARLSHSKQLLKNIHTMTLSLFLFTNEKIFTVTMPKNPKMTDCKQLQQSRRKM